MSMDGREEDRVAAIVMASIGMICGFFALVLSVIAVSYAFSHTSNAADCEFGMTPESKEHRGGLILLRDCDWL